MLAEADGYQICKFLKSRIASLRRAASRGKAGERLDVEGILTLDLQRHEVSAQGGEIGP